MTKSDKDFYVSSKNQRLIQETLGIDNVSIHSVEEDDELDFIQPEDIVIAQTRNDVVLRKIAKKGVRSTIESRDTIMYTKDKEVVKERLLAAGICCPKSYTIQQVSDAYSGERFFVKPLLGEDSKGITPSSVCSTLSEVCEQTQALQLLGYEAIVEEFIDGVDATVAVFKDATKGGEVRCYPISVCVDSQYGIITHEKKHAEDEVCSAISNDRLSDIAKDVFEAVGGKHYMRIDFRISKNGTPYCIDLNLYPGLGITDHLAKCTLLCSNMSYRDTLNQVINTAYKVSLESYEKD